MPVEGYRDNLKLSDYLNNILVENERIAQHNRYWQEERRRHPTWSDEDINRRMGGSLKTLVHVPSEAELEAKFGGHFENIKVLAKIGQDGKKIHKVVVRALNTSDGYIIYSAYSDCGSQRWSRQGRSPIFPIGSRDLSRVNCDKCRGIRVKGGKAPEPSKRKVIDPNTRPKEYHFNYKADYKPWPGHAPTLGATFNDRAKGMTEEEARGKLYRREMPKDESNRMFSRVYDFELTAIYAWNGVPIWRKSSGSPAPKDVSTSGERTIFPSDVTGASSKGQSTIKPTVHERRGPPTMGIVGGR